MKGQEKIARKRSADPKQETLREHKDQWNKDMSLLIAQLIAFKRGLNGRGEPRVGLPPSSIKEPIPNEVGQYLEQMASRFQKIVSEADHIIDEQTDYAKTRKKSRKELQESGQMPQEMVPSTAASEALLIKDASWWGSRLWSYFKYSPRIWNEHLRLRMRLLWVSSDVSNGLLDLENYLISGDENAIPRSCYTLIKMRNRVISDMVVTFEQILKEITDLTVSKPKQEEMPASSIMTPGAVLPTPLSGKEEFKQSESITDLDKSSWNPNINWDEINRIHNDLTSVTSVVNVLEAQNILPSMDAKSVNNLHKKITTLVDSIGFRKIDDKYLENSESAAKMKADVDELFFKYQQIFMHVSKVLSTKFGKQFNSFTEMLPIVKDMLAAGKNLDINKLAHNWLSRMIKRWQLNILPSYTDKIRLKCVDTIRILHKEVGDLQDLLENKDSNIIDSAKKLKNILENFAILSKDMVDLAQNHNAEYEEKKLSEKKIKIKPVSGRYIGILALAERKFNRAAEELGSAIVNLNNALEGKPAIVDKSEDEVKAKRPKKLDEYEDSEFEA
jgi:hypothetical protein